VLTLGLPLLVFGIHAHRYGQWIVDDAAISYAYARSLADGDGVVQQPGAATVEGFSNPLWTALLVVLKWLGLFDSGFTVAGWPDYVAVPRLIAVAGLLGTVAILWWAFRPLVGTYSWTAALLTGLGLAVNPSYVIWTVSGLENPLYGLLVAALAAVLMRAAATDRLTSPPVAVVTGALALSCALTRPDGVVYVAAYPSLLALLLYVSGRASLGLRAWLWPSARAALLSGLVFGVPMAAFLLARHAMFGLWVPNTAIAKAQQGITSARLAKSGMLLGYVGWPVILTSVAVVGLALGLAWQRAATLRRADTVDPVRIRPDARLWPGVLGLVICLLAALSAFGALENDWMAQYRFATPVWVAGTALFALCLVWSLTSGAVSRRGAVALAVVAALSVGYSGALFRGQSTVFRSEPTTPMCMVTDRYGRLFNTYAEELGVATDPRTGHFEGSLALPDIGGALLTSRLRVVDTAGLTDRAIAEARQQRDYAALGDYLYDEVKPTFIRFYGHWGTGVADDPRLERDYAELRTGDYVRRDAVPDAPTLQRVRNVAAGFRLAPALSSCGDRLSPGGPRRPM
jgi:hypothetical protein